MDGWGKRGTGRVDSERKGPGPPSLSEGQQQGQQQGQRGRHRVSRAGAGGREEIGKVMGGKVTWSPQAYLGTFILS